MLGQLDPVLWSSKLGPRDTGLICQLWGSPEWNEGINTLTWVVKKPKESQFWFTYMKEERGGSLSRLLVLFYVQSIKHVMGLPPFHISITFLTYITVLSILLSSTSMWTFQNPPTSTRWVFLLFKFSFWKQLLQFFQSYQTCIVSTTTLQLLLSMVPSTHVKVIITTHPPSPLLLFRFEVITFHTLQFK